MKYGQVNIQKVLHQYKQFYETIGGGIDGYYEKVILEADVYEIVEESSLGCFTVHRTRGLTSLIVYPEYKHRYDEIFSYVVSLPLIRAILFTGNDLDFMNCIEKHKIDYEVQSLNFTVDDSITSTLKMVAVQKENHQQIESQFGEFLDYNGIDLNTIKAFYYKQNDIYICFGAVEPLNLNENRYCLSMIVNESFRRKNYGTETIKFLIQYLQERHLEANARCYVKNEVSRTTLIKSGMKFSNYLYKSKNWNNEKE